MSLEFYRNLTRVFGIIALGVLFGLIASASLLEVKDLDLWLHIKMGEIVTSTGHVPAQDILSGTIAGKPWVNHEWLFQNVVYSVSSVFGMDGLLYMQSFLVVLTFLFLLLWTYRTDRQLVIIPLLFYVLQIYQTRFTVRPDIFSILYFILFLMVLMTSMEKRWSLFALFFLQVLWTNMHGYFFWGPVLVMFFLGAEILRRHAPLPAGWREEGRLSNEGFRRLAVALGVVLLSTLVNPLTWEGAVYPLKVMLQLSGESKIFFKYITELQPSIHWSTFFDFSEGSQLKVLMIVSFVSFVFNIRRMNMGLFLVWIVMLFFAVGAMRNMIYFAVVAYVATLINVARLDLRAYVPARFINEPVEMVAGWLAKIILMGIILNYGGDIARRGYYDFNHYERKSEFFGVAQRMFPEGAVDFLIKNKISGAVFNDFNVGAYLVGRTYPQIKVFIDGRTEVYGAPFFMSYRKIWDDGDEAGLREAVSKYGLKAAVIGAAYARPSEEALRLFSKSPDWKLVYFDHDGLIFLRDIPDNAALIQKYAIDLKKWSSVPSDTHRMGSAQAYPYREVNRATMLKDMGYLDQAMAEADAALAVSPLCLEAFKIKAQVYAERKDHLKAFEYFRAALLQSTGDVNLRRGMAIAYVGLGEYDHALEQAERLDESPLDVAGPYVRAKVFAKKGQYQKAYDILVQKIFPLQHGAREIVAIGDIFAEDKSYDLAVKAYGLAVRKDPKNKEALKKLKETVQLRQEAK
ncbi:MAG: hypothetical protein HQL17_08135 [Candidatus Omnitrophica bacterium]|nr:hypothetical protein [Candidatus Omnitrophota bacterium]